MDADFQARANALVAQSNGAIWIESGDRDTETQTRLYAEAVAKYGEAEAGNWVAPPGHSNHEKGIAIDFGGDLTLLAQLAPQFGIYQPMSWEPWHFEPVGSRSNDPMAYTNRPSNPSSLIRGTKTTDYSNILGKLFNLKPYQPQTSTADITFTRGGTEPIVAANPGFLTKELQDILGPGPQLNVQGTGSSASQTIPSSGQAAGIDAFMAALRATESSNNYQAIGAPTPWGTATGAYQYLDGTWNNYKGYARAADAPAAVQDEKARADMLDYYSQFGSWDNVSAAWYSGPNGNWQSQEVQDYIRKVNQNLG